MEKDDPTHGAVDYVPATTAVKRGLAYIDKDKSAVLKVDATSWLKRGELRKSVRLESKKKVQLGSIVIADFAHVPFGAGVWPACSSSLALRQFALIIKGRSLAVSSLRRADASDETDEQGQVRRRLANSGRG